LRTGNLYSFGVQLKYSDLKYKAAKMRFIKKCSSSIERFQMYADALLAIKKFHQNLLKSLKISNSPDHFGLRLLSENIQNSMDRINRIFSNSNHQS